jgi:hypothetical protein
MGPLFVSLERYCVSSAHRGLVIAHAIVIATPPIGAPGDESLAAQPPAIVVGVVIPDPDAIHEHPMTMMEAVKVVVALREAAVLEPLAAVVALYESTTITVLEPATLATHSRPSKVTATAVTACHCVRMATTAPTTATMAAAPATATAPTATAAADKRDDTIMVCAEGTL